jgi:hypothetical protein
MERLLYKLYKRKIHDLLSYGWGSIESDKYKYLESLAFLVLPLVVLFVNLVAYSVNESSDGAILVLSITCLLSLVYLHRALRDWFTVRYCLKYYHNYNVYRIGMYRRVSGIRGCSTLRTTIELYTSKSQGNVVNVNKHLTYLPYYDSIGEKLVLL